MEKETYIFKVNNFTELKNNSWGGAISTLEAIEDKGLEEEFLSLLNDIISSYNNGMEETKLNDFIWFDCEYIEEALGVKLYD